MIQCCVPFGIRHSAFGIPAKKDTHKTGAGGETIVKDKSQSTWLKLSETFVCGFAAGGEVKIRWSRLACKIQQ